VTDIEKHGVQVLGVYVGSVTSTRDIINNLMSTFMFDVFEVGTGFKFAMRRSPTVVSVELDDFILSGAGADTYAKTRAQDTDLPARNNVTFIDPDQTYQQNSVDGQTVMGFSQNVAQFSSLAVLLVSDARSLADILTQETWTARNSIKFSLPLNYLKLDLNDVFALNIGGVTRRYKVAKLTLGDQIDVEAVGYSEVVYGGNTFGGFTAKAQTVTVAGRTLAIFADIPLSDMSSPNLWSPRVMMTQSPWPGSANLFESDDAGGYVLNNSAMVPAVLGVTMTALAAGPTWVWDTSNSVTIKLHDTDQALAGTTDQAVYNGANTMGILTPSGEWEIFQFANVTLNMDGTYTLSRLLRGVLGTEAYMGAPTPSGATVFLFDPTRFSYIAGTDSRIGLSLSLRYGPGTVDVTDTRYKNATVVPEGVALRPYAPVHLRQTKVGNDIILTWIRRDRFGADSWNIAEVAMNEAIEQYVVEITGGSTFTVTGGTTFTYTESQQISDFSSVQDSVTWAVSQVSATFGKGTPAHG
jgi:hypothetical protein